MVTILWSGLGLWLALNGVVAARLIHRSSRRDMDLPDTVILPLRLPS